MNPHQISRRHFVQGLIACAMPPTGGVLAAACLTPELTPAVIRDRIGTALDLQALFTVAIDQVDIDALTENRLLRATNSYGEGKYRGRDAAMAAVLRHGPEFGSAAGSFLLLGVRRPCYLRLSDIAAARQEIRANGAKGQQFIYAAYPDRNLLDGQVEATLIAA